MLFFKRILKSEKDSVAAQDKRGALRYSVGAAFPMRAVLNLAGRDEFGHPLRTKDGLGWDWAGRLVNFSNNGARMQLPASVSAARGDTCHLKLDVDGYRLEIPGRVVNIREQNNSIVFGLRLDFDEPETQKAYHQLLDLVALGASLKPVAAPPDDGSGYAREQYVGQARAKLTFWRSPGDNAVVAFEFQLRDGRVRGVAGQRLLEYLAADDETKALPPAKREELHRLFQWVVPNISTVVPCDARQFLQRAAA